MCLEFLPDSPEQIVHSIEMVGLQANIDQAFQTAIAKLKEHPQRSSEPPLNEPEEGECDSL